MDSNTGSELIVTLAWRSAEIAGLAAVLMLMTALLVRSHLQRMERRRAAAVAVWRPLLTRIAIEEGETPELPKLPSRHLPYLLEEWNALHDAVRGSSAEKLNATAKLLGLDYLAYCMVEF